MKRFLLDKEAAKAYLLPKRLRDIRRAIFFMLVLFLYIYFYKHQNWLEHQSVILFAFGGSLVLLIASQALIYHLGVRKYANSHFFVDGAILYHEWKNGKSAFLDLSITDRVNSDLRQGDLTSPALYMELPVGIKDRNELLTEIHMTMEIYGDRAMEKETGLERLWRSGILYRSCLFILLTILTQTGGFVYLLAHFISKKWQLNKVKRRLLFVSTYLLFCLLLIPLVAPVFGRSALPINGQLKPLNYLTVLLNRHYVSKELKDLLLEATDTMHQQYQSPIRYLDANFPFINGFPLIPHLSHNDGKKVDLAFYYKDKQTGEASDGSPSFIGYGVYESPEGGETDYPEQCSMQGYWQYGALEILVPQWRAHHYTVDAERTRALLEILLEQKETSKIFIEPHLKNRWGLELYDKVRFHGCRAVRHDDHIHLQIQ